MKYMRQVADERGTERQELAVNSATKLARTFSTQLEALKRYRTGGEQKVTVQHVSVSRGGRAAFVAQNLSNEKPRKTSLKKPAQTPALTNSRQVAMPSLEDEKKAWVEYERKKKIIIITLRRCYRAHAAALERARASPASPRR